MKLDVLGGRYAYVLSPNLTPNSYSKLFQKFLTMDDDNSLGRRMIISHYKGWAKKCAFFSVVYFGKLPTSISWKRFVRMT